MTDIISNLAVIHARINEACRKAGRLSSEVKLLLATKTVAAHNICIALRNGETLIGENKVQELEDKYDSLKTIPHQTHFIGHLQTNKIKKVIQYADCIQSLDRMELARKLHKQLQQEGKTMEVLIQVNTSAETSKFGIEPAHAAAFVKEIAGLGALKIKGLMTIGLFSAEENKVRDCFKLLGKVKNEISGLNIPGVEMKELSMGMSGDLEIAIEEGATIIRVGTAIFGKRIHPDSYYWNEAK
ncbi:MAG: YggS family pyridoxal phosphate-dependent enzyme [Chitinophagaceae bacterium]|nr:YggS family pyridoxal phosphate-dependent enzyme [Chitinophagaceae bacterium]